MRALCSSLAPPPGERRLLSAPQALTVFSEQVLERRVVQHRLGQQLLQSAILILQGLQPARLRALEPTVLCLPLVEGRVRDAVPATYLWRLCPRLRLPQDPDYLFLVEPAALHLSVSFQ